MAGTLALLCSVAHAIFHHVSCYVCRHGPLDHRGLFSVHEFVVGNGKVRRERSRNKGGLEGELNKNGKERMEFCHFVFSDLTTG